MARKIEIARPDSPSIKLPKVVPDIHLSHGQAIWILSQLGFRGNVSESTFHEYIKSLRKLGIPFAPGEIGLARRGRANYSFVHSMELALTLTLRVYRAVPDSLLAEIIRNRQLLHRQFRRAYIHRLSDEGAPIRLHFSGLRPIETSGLFLDLQLEFAGGKLISFGPTRLLAPVDAIEMFLKRDYAARALVPFNLSRLAERVIEASIRARDRQRCR